MLIDVSPDRIGAGIPRFIEVTLAGAGIVLLAPVLALVAFGIRVSTRGPIFFRQVRIGRYGRSFTLLKFRTMQVGSALGIQVTTKGDARITPIGRWLRLSKLDEFPAMWNVLHGEMSLVGPRPEVPAYVDLDNPAWQAVLRVRPGITDPVTLQLRNEEDLMAVVPGDKERFYLDTLQPYKLACYQAYLLRRTWWTDFSVVFRTLFAVLIPGAAPTPSVNEIQTAIGTRSQTPPSVR
ncbi:MAG: sugar transferase [Gemmatimonadaceae bacterium]